MSANPDFSASRRSFLKLPSQPEAAAIRPPWSDEASVRAHCTGCKACVEACPETILLMDRAGKPKVEFDGRECTFCRKCAESCGEPVFDLTRSRPWDLKATIAAGCLQEHGISCQLCRDACPVSAIRVDLDKRPFGRLKIEEAACTGCGACLSVCPQEVLSLITPNDATELA